MIINRVTMLGNIGKPELRTSASGYAYLNFKMLEPGAEVTCTMNGKPAERAFADLQRGDLLLIEGKVITREVPSKKTGGVYHFTEIAVISYIKLEEKIDELPPKDLKLGEKVEDLPAEPDMEVPF